MVISKSSMLVFENTVVILLLEHFALASLTQTNDELEEAIQDFCPSEIFHPQCPTGDVILMKSAIYGRMRIGRCITKEEVDILRPGHEEIGCSSDVLDVMDRKCSRKTECSIRIFDISLETTRPCSSAVLNLYLETKYECIKVADEKRSCSVDVSSSSPIHIVNWKTSCGMSTQPWTVIAPIGQRIIISRIILKTTAPPLRSSSKVGKVNEKCSSSTSHVIIVDKAAKRNSSECTSGSEREEEIYSSTGNSVDVYLRSSDNTTTRENNEEFILKFQAVGCSDIIPPSDAYFKRVGETVIVGCYVSRKTWHLYCDNGRWIGVIGNCSQGKWEDQFEFEPEIRNKVESSRSELVLWIVGIGGFAVSMCLAVICFVAVFIRRKRSKADQKKREYKTLKHQFNPFENQRTMIESGNGATVIPVVNDAHCSTTTQPTYSVFVGDGRFKDDNDQVN